MSTQSTKGGTWPAVRLILLIIGGIVVGNILVTVLMTRDTALGFDELIAFGGGALLGVLIEFGLFRRSRR